MNNLMKPIVSGALIIAFGVFLAAQRIAYVESFEGRWDSCVTTFNNNATRTALGFSQDADRTLAEKMCLRIYMGGGSN